MPFVKVDALIDDFPASGIYKQDSSSVWSQISPNNDYKFDIANSKWRLVANSSGSAIVKEISTGTQNSNPKNATWVKYTVVDWVSPLEIPATAISAQSPNTYPTVTPTPGSPNTYPTPSPSPASPNQI